MSELVRRVVDSAKVAITTHAMEVTPAVQAVAIGTPAPRLDGPAKVTGAAKYAADITLPGMAYAAMVLSTIPRGQVTSIDAESALRLPGVLAIYSHANAPRLGKNLMPQIDSARWSVGSDWLPLQDASVHFAGQPVALVVAETWEQAHDAAAQVHVTYAPEAAQTDLARVVDDSFPAKPKIGKADYARGDAPAALASAAVRVTQEYGTPPQTNNPLGLFATVASWEGNQLTLHDANQSTRNVAKSAASVFKLTLGRGGVDVLTPFVGGGFGAGLRAWPHSWLAAMAARELARPVKLVLTRSQMFTSIGRRAQTIHHLALGASADGDLVAITHQATQDTSREETFIEALTGATRMLYACPNVATHYRIARVDRSTPTYMRCPGEAETLFALECGMDELAEALAMDPIALRQRNDAATDPAHNRPWSSKSLSACFARGAELFDWQRRTPMPGSMRDGDILIGLGTASATYPAFTIPASARVRLEGNGTALVQTAATDIGPGTGTALCQIAADALGLPLAQVRYELGDSSFPKSSPQGGSMLLSSVGSAVHLVATELRQKLVALDSEGILRQGDGATRCESFAAILARTGQPFLEAEGSSQSFLRRLRHSCHAFGAQFAEVHVDMALRTIRVARLLGVFGVGRVINPRLAHSQLMGGMIWGLSQALLEETTYDHGLGRIVNASFGDYLVPVNADVQQVEVEVLPEDDPYVNPLGTKGVGEVGMAGVAPAIANAIYHATGIRVRELPITLETLLPAP